jgi:hypothetical protein
MVKNQIYLSNTQGFFYMSDFVNIHLVSLKTFENFKIGELSSGSVPGITIVDRKKIDIDDIYFQNDGTNIVRQEKAKEEAIRALQNDFETRGWCVGSPLPCVVENDGTEVEKYGGKKFRLVHGHYRTSAILRTGRDNFIYNVIVAIKQGRFSKQSVINLYSLKSNVDHLVHTKATKTDVAKVIAAGMSDGTFNDSCGHVDEDAIRDIFSMNPDYISFTKNKATLTDLIGMARSWSGRTDLIICTNVEFKRALKDAKDPLHLKIERGEVHLFDSSDPTRGFGRLISAYVGSGFEVQEIVINVNDFKIKSIDDLMKKRQSIINAIDQCYNDARLAYGKNITPKDKIYRIIGFSASIIKTEIESGRNVIPVKEAIRVKATKPLETKVSIVQPPEGKKLKSNKLNKVLDLE